jgi:hypothetical protein
MGPRNVIGLGATTQRIEGILKVGDRAGVALALWKTDVRLAGLGESAHPRSAATRITSSGSGVQKSTSVATGEA